MEETNINKKIEEQGAILQKLVEQSIRTQKTLNWLRVMGVIRIIIIVTPIVLGIIYLPSFARNIIEEYRDVMPNNTLDIAL